MWSLPRAEQRPKAFQGVGVDFMETIAIPGILASRMIFVS
jgi:hypothetical protein